MNLWLVSAVLLLFIGSVSSQLPPWDNQLFGFQLTPNTSTIARCSNIAIEWSDRVTIPPSTPPYTITVICGGYQPIRIPNNESSNSFSWTVNIPSPGPYIMFMEDANGFSGGASHAFTVMDMNTTCSLAPVSYPLSSFQLTSDGTLAECSNLVVTATGGTAPYKMQIVPASGRPPKTTTWSTRQMLYTIDMKPGEQFFVLVTDANGNSGVEPNIGANPIYTVVPGDNTGCYGLASTVAAGVLSTTLSYDPSSTVSFPSGGGASATIAPANTPTSETSSPMPAIIGGVVGGAVLLFSLILFLCLRRRAARAKQVRMQEIYDPHSMPIGARPYTPAPPGRDTAPLVGRTNSTNSTGSGQTPAPSTPGMSFFGGNNNPTTPSHEETQPGYDRNTLMTPDREEPPAWTIPATSPTDSNMYNRHSGGTFPLTESSSMHARSASVSSRPNGLPPGAMIPNAEWGLPEKARFVPASPSIVAPPSYTQGM